MAGIVYVWFSSVMFIHMGLGEVIGRILHIDFVLLRCVKCITFWSILIYSLLIVSLPVEAAIALSFILGYAAIWAELLLGKIAMIYEKLDNGMEPTKEKTGRRACTGQQKGE